MSNLLLEKEATDKDWYEIPERFLASGAGRFRVTPLHIAASLST